MSYRKGIEDLKNVLFLILRWNFRFFYINVGNIFRVYFLNGFFYFFKYWKLLVLGVVFSVLVVWVYYFKYDYVYLYRENYFRGRLYFF